MSEGAEQHEVLLSYSTPDVELARRVAELLHTEQVSVWWDKGQRTDPALGTVTEILGHLMGPLLVHCKYLFVIATGAALASDWVPVEVSAFLDSKRPVLAWHPRDDDFDPRRYRPGMSQEAYKKVVRLVEHEDVIAHYDLPRSDVDRVGRNVAFFVRFFRFIEGKGAVVSNRTRSEYWDEYVTALRQQVS